MPKKSGASNKSREVFKKKKTGACIASREGGFKTIKQTTPSQVNPAASTKQVAQESKKEQQAQPESSGKEISRTLTHHQWYHGMMPRDEIEDLLKKDGDFLVRRTEVENEGRYAVSVYNNNRVRHILLSHHDGLWAIRDVKMKTIIELIEHIVEKKLPVQKDGTLLIAAVPRPEYYILHEHIEIGKKLGSGAFGDVHIGVLKKAHGEGINVAIKKFKGSMHKKERYDFVKEARLMRKFNHPNLVQIIGVAPNETPMMIILELCPGGSIHSYLKNHQELGKDKLTDFCIDACRGMCYLSLRKVIHRDIAARNCLLGKNDEVKISDFGLSVANTDVLKLDKKLKSVPVRWLSPEILKKGEFSTKSDVWAFGVMIWEIFAYCKSDPFPGLTNAEAKTKISSGSDPFDAPEGTPQLIQTIMKLCFIQDPAQRPDFESLLKLLSPKETPPSKDD